MLPQGSGHSCKAARAQHLGNTLRHRLGLLGCPVQGQDLHWMILVGPFRAKIFCDICINLYKYR